MKKPNLDGTVEDQPCWNIFCVEMYGGNHICNFCQQN